MPSAAAMPAKVVAGCPHSHAYLFASPKQALAVLHEVLCYIAKPYTSCYRRSIHLALVH